MTKHVNAFRNIVLTFSFLMLSFPLYSEEEKVFRIQRLHPPHTEIGFSFDSFETKWFISQEQLDSFWEKYSLVGETPPEFEIDWESETLLAVFWEGKDQVVRHPSLANIEIDQREDDEKTLKLQFHLNHPCFGFITKDSPALFAVFKHRDLYFQDIVFETEETKTINCEEQ